MNESLTLFVDNMYWIDILVILLLIGGWCFLIIYQTRKTVEKNKKYNTELYAMRSEIYTEYEKNFFL